MENKKCPICGTDFLCRHNDIIACQCSSVLLNDLQREYIKKNYNDCLCLTCLREISKREIK